MTLFDKYRKKDQTIADLENYYSGKSKTGAAWLMALLSLLITVIIIGAFFFGGRWLYRLITDSNDTTLQTNGQSDGQNSGTASQSEQTDTPSSSPDSDTSNNDFPSVVTDEAARTDVPSTAKVAQNNNASQQQTTATQGATTSTIPKTGSETTLLTIPIITGIAGYLFAIRRRISKN